MYMYIYTHTYIHIYTRVIYVYPSKKTFGVYFKYQSTRGRQILPEHVTN